MVVAEAGDGMTLDYVSHTGITGGTGTSTCVHVRTGKDSGSSVDKTLAVYAAEGDPCVSSVCEGGGTLSRTILGTCMSTAKYEGRCI